MRPPLNCSHDLFFSGIFFLGQVFFGQFFFLGQFSSSSHSQVSLDGPKSSHDYTAQKDANNDDDDDPIL